MSPKDTHEGSAMHSKSGNIELISNDEADEAIKELFESYLSRYWIG